jgi:hypothetical protein
VAQIYPLWGRGFACIFGYTASVEVLLISAPQTSCPLDVATCEYGIVTIWAGKKLKQKESVMAENQDVFVFIGTYGSVDFDKQLEAEAKVIQ